jgi:hypothetical protein
VSIADVELFTPGLLRDPEVGRAFVRALNEHVPSWMPYRYGWSEPLRSVFDPERVEHFWGQIGFWRNAARTANGTIEPRTGPWDLLSSIKLSGDWTPETPDLKGLGAFLADCASTLDVTYGMAHLFTADGHNGYQRDWFALSPEPERVKKARQGPFPHFLRDLYWGNVFGPPYVELFGAERLRTAPAAIARELRPGYFYLQLTEDITDGAGLADARRTVKAHLGADCFYDPAATTPRRAPVFRTAAEEGLWKPVKGTPMTDELRELLATAPAAGSGREDTGDES